MAFPRTSTDLAARHFRKLSRKLDRDELRKSVVGYERLLADAASAANAGDPAGAVPRAVLRCIDVYEARRTPVDAVRALGELRGALSGGRFWTDGMTPDDHRA